VTNITEFGASHERDWETNTDFDPVRYAVIGLGGFAQDYVIPAIIASDFCTFTTAVSGSLEKARSVIDRFDATQAITYEDFHKGDSADSYDVVYVATPPSYHLKFVQQAAIQGKDVLCEKPLAATVEDARKIVEASSQHNVKLMVAYRLQTDPAIRYVRDLIQDGLLGGVTQIQGEFTYPILSGERDRDHWRLDPDVAGGGALMDIGIYPLNLSRFFLDADPKATQSVLLSPDEGFEGIDEYATFLLEFPDETVASCIASFNSYRGNSMQIIGTEGRIALDTPFGILKQRRITIYTDSTKVSVKPPQTNELIEQADYFAHAVRSGSEIAPDGIDGLTDMMTLRSVYEAAQRESRTSVSIDEQLESIENT